MQLNNFTTSEAFDYAFRASLQVHPIEGYDPTTQLVVSDVDVASGGQPSCFLPLDAKRLWFNLWCQKEGKTPRIVTECVDLKFDVTGNNGVRFGYAVAKAEVYADDVLLSAFTAGQSFSVDAIIELDNVIQSVQGLALTKALTNAGFGAVPSSKVEEKKPGANAAGQAAQTAELPFTATGLAETSAPTVNAQPAAQPKPQKTAAPAAAQPVATTDPKEAAKMVVSTMRGKYSGMKLGEILLTSPKTIEYIALSWAGDETVKNAAKLLLNDALVAQGKAPMPE